MIRKSILFIILFTASQFGIAQRIAIATKAIGMVEINKKAQPGYNNLKAGTILEAVSYTHLTLPTKRIV